MGQDSNHALQEAKKKKKNQLNNSTIKKKLLKNILQFIYSLN